MDEEDHSSKRQKLDSGLRVLNMARTIDACQRCRSKKVKCDQNFPTCFRCQKAQAECVGVDRATGRAVPRSYIYHLEQKVASLEKQLSTHGISAKGSDHVLLPASLSQSSSLLSTSMSLKPMESIKPRSCSDHVLGNGSNYMGASLGISFAILITAALKMKEKTSHLQVDPLRNPVATNDTPAVLPPKATAQEFVRVYFAHSNSQLPILHREAFLTEFFEPIYGSWDNSLSRSPAPFSQINRGSKIPEKETWIFECKQIISQNLKSDQLEPGAVLRPSPVIVPERYHRPLFYLNIVFAIASSVNHLQYVNYISEQFRITAFQYVNAAYNTHDPLEQLQAKLLLALFSLMRPSKPGIWYLLGHCLRICVDLGLHNNATDKSANLDAFTKDRRRRLFWCTYSLDRQTCFYMGRPVGIPEASIKTKFPSEVDDAYIIEGSTEVKDYSEVTEGQSSFKKISLSFFQIRKIQLEVQRILYEGEELPRRFATLAEWKGNMQVQLDDWWLQARRVQQLVEGEFHLEFFSLNYHHTVISLYGLSPKCFKLSQDSLMRVAAALETLMRCYLRLYTKKAINYTWAAVHNLFMAGASFLYVLFQSETVRRLYTKEIVMKVSEDCITVLTLLIASCDAAKDCSHMFRILTAAVLKLRYNEDVAGSTRLIDDPDSPLRDADQSGTTGLKEGTAEAMPGFVETTELGGASIGPEENGTYSMGGYMFEWISRRTASEPTAVGVKLTDDALYFQESNFMDYLTPNLSPGNSMPDTVEGSLPDYSMEMEGDGDIFPHSRDGRKAYDLLQIPTELIWDQFFSEHQPAIKMEEQNALGN